VVKQLSRALLRKDIQKKLVYPQYKKTPRTFIPGV